MSPEPQRRPARGQVPEEEQKPKPKRRQVRSLIAATLVVVLAASAGAGWYLVSGRGGKGDAAASETENLKSLTLDSFTVNLAEPGYRRYLRATVTLEYTGKDLEKEMAQKDYRVRDAIINVLRSKTALDLSTPERTTELRQELVEAVNSVLSGSQVKNIYFRDFIIQ